jgi:hypothetical protein
MQLLAAHQILIGAAIALAVLFGLRSLVVFVREGGGGALGLAVASIVLAGLLGLYFRTVRAKWLALKREQER